MKIADKQKNQEIEKIVKIIVDHFAPQTIYLFGSYARGDYNADSDFDFLIVMKDLPAKPFELSGEAHEVLWKKGVTAPADLIFISSDKFQSLKDTINTLPNDAVTEGEELYAA